MKTLTEEISQYQAEREAESIKKAQKATDEIMLEIHSLSESAISPEVDGLMRKEIAEIVKGVISI